LDKTEKEFGHVLIQEPKPLYFALSIFASALKVKSNIGYYNIG
jgi:hypothetical protein